MKYLFAVILLLTSIGVFGQSDELIQAYQNYQSYYKNGNVDLAIEWAKKALALEVEEFGKDDLDHGTTLNNLATIYQNRKQYKEAIPLFKEAAGIYKKQLGEKHPDYGTLLNNLAVLYDNQKQWKEAEPLYLKVLEIRKEQLGEKSPKYLDALANVAEIYAKLEQYPKSIDYYQQLLSKREEVSGKQHKSYVHEVIDCATVYALMDSVQRAEKYYLEGIQAARVVLGMQHEVYGHSTSKLAALYENQGKYSKAEPLYEESANSFKATYGRQDTTYASALINLAILYEELGKYEPAQHTYEEAISIFRLKLGVKHPKYAEALNNKAGLFIELGKYSKAELLYQQASKVYERRYGKQHDSYTAILNNMAILYEKMGKANQAEKLYQQILSLYQQSVGKEHADYALVLNNLATLLKEKKEYGQAEKLYKEALVIKKKRLGEKHPEYAISLNNLAGLYKNMGKLKEAEPLYKQALTIKKQSLGERHPEYAISLNNLASLYEELKEYAKAEPFYLQALAIIKQHLGEKHPSFATTLNNMAVLYQSMGKYDKAESYYIQANQNLLYQIQYYFPYLNESSRKSFWDQNLRSGFSKFYHFANVRSVANPKILGHAYDYRLATKALLLDGTAKMRNAIVKSNDDDLINRYNAWITLKNSIAQAYTLSKDELDKYNWDVGKLQQEASRLESELSRQSSHFSHATEVHGTTWRDVQRHLKEDEAAIEMIRVLPSGNPEEVHYLAIIIKANATAHPELVVFDKGKELEEKFIRYYRNCISFQLDDEYSYRMFWQPIASLLKGMKKVYFSADGVYNQINLATLRNPDTNKFLAEETNIHLVTNTREIVNWTGNKNNNRTAFLLGHPSYKIDTNAEMLAKGTTRSATRIGKWFEQSTFDDLPGTEEEIIKIAEGLQAQDWQLTIKLQEQATEEEVKQLSNPTILHVATHGFFIPSEDATTGVGHTTENPMLRSGIILAGVENYYSSKERPNTEDGILTAYEATTLFLDQTELVVLSACETGLGETKDGEGVYGLQRAFKVAGAKTILMSLWKVDDEATQQLMAAFYKNWLQTKDKRKAFQMAQLQLQSTFKEPYYWGAFVMVGE